MQMFSIHGLYHNTVIPLCYALLSDKLAITYYSVFNRLRDAASSLGYVLNPSYILSDFEAGLINVVQQQFPNTSHIGCRFHFGQAIWRKVQEQQLSSLYKTDGVVTNFVESCVAIAFIPAAEVELNFETFISSLEPQYATLLADFFNYFRSTWLFGKFPIKMWNVYGHDHLHRTNNVVESWHAGLKRKFPNHPNVFTYISGIKAMQSCTEMRIVQASNGESPARRRLKYRKLEAQLAKLHQQHETNKITTSELWRSVRHNVRKFKK